MSYSLNDLSSELNWLHKNNSSLNELFALNCYDSFKDGDFFVLFKNNHDHDVNIRNIDISRHKTKDGKQVCYNLIVFNSFKKWLNFEIIEETSKRKMLLNLSRKNLYLNLNEQSNKIWFNSIANLISFYKKNGIINDNREISLKNGLSKQEFTKKLSNCINIKEMREKQAPRKPVRMPTIKTTKKPDILLNKLDKEELIITNDFNDLLRNDINAPKLNLKSLFDLKSFKCDIIANKAKKLDRLALIETHRTLQLKSIIKDFDCDHCLDLTQNLAVYLAKYLTYEDLRVLRFNFDFGLGIFTGLEMITLPQGNLIRSDTIQRSKSCSLFIVLLIVLCQNSNDRIDLIIKLLDCAVVLFDKINNLFAFSYIMEAFNHPQVKRLDSTWLLLNSINESKFKLMHSLLEKYFSLNKGDFLFFEQNALIPNINTIAMLFNDNLIEDFTELNSVLTNSRYFASNANKYAQKCELFIQNEHNKLFKVQSNPNCLNLARNLSYISQTEFHQIIMWGEEVNEIDKNKNFNDINQLIQILSFKIQPTE